MQDREANILRRFKVAPISPLPLLVASLVTGLVIYLPSSLLMLAAGAFHLRHGVAAAVWLSLLVFIMLGVLAFRATRADDRLGGEFHAGEQASWCRSSICRCCS